MSTPDDFPSSQQPCCGGENCETSADTRFGRGWKTGIFTVVILLAVGVSAYSLFMRDPVAVECGETTTACGPLTTIPHLQDRLAGYDFALLVFPHQHEILPDAFNESLTAVGKAIKNKGGKVVILTLHQGDPGFPDAIARHKITSFPAVLALGVGSSSVFQSGNISKEALLALYQKSTAKKSSCCPAGN